MRLDIHHHHHYQHDVDGDVIAAFVPAFEAILNKLEQVMHTLEETLALVTDQKTRIDSLVALTTDLHQKVIDALGASLTPSQQMRVDAIFDAVKNNADEVDAAITANTVSATAGAVSDGPSASDIKADINSQSSTSPIDGGAPAAAVDGSPAV